MSETKTTQPTVCPNCGYQLEPEAGTCPNCGAYLKTKYPTASPAATLQQESSLQAPAKRPFGIIILSILGSVAGAYLFYAGLTGLNADLEVWTLMSEGHEFEPLLKNWLSWAIPLETVLMLIAFVLGLMLLTTIFGLINGKSWSYKYGIRLPIVGMIISWTALFLSFTAPVFVEEALLGTIVRAVISVVGALMYILYLRQPHVKDWLNVDTKGQPKSNPETAEKD